MVLRIETKEPSLPGFCPVEAAVNAMSSAGVEARGAIFTRREVVEFILDLIGYTADRRLAKAQLLEPSFGHGDFLLPAIDRLLTSWRRSAKSASDAREDLRSAIQAVELHRDSFEEARIKVLETLERFELKARDRSFLADAWLMHGDYLLADLKSSKTHIVGNPPYVRQELIPDALMNEYRQRYTTIFDRADIYIPFIERSLKLLAKSGVLGFICADRWTKNRYGGPLRKMIADKYHLRAYVDMVDTPAFHSDVIAYPAIFVFGNEAPGPTRIALRPVIDSKVLKSLARRLTEAAGTSDDVVKEAIGVASGAEPWLLDSPDQLMVIRRIERDFPLIEDAGCKVGIGVATGADQVFIAPFDELDVEPDRKLPLVMTRDISNGTVQWRGYGVINPFLDEGGLISLEKYPKLAKLLEARGDEIRTRHVSKKNPSGWFRTIDRIYPALATKPKLLIPDIKGEAHIVYEDGKLYPHHNLYYITSDEWDLRALQAVLLSGIARLFVSTYSTKMRGGYLRFQAQYLRRIRVPRWRDVPDDLKRLLKETAEQGDIEGCNRAVVKLYGLTKAEQATVGMNER